MAISNKRTDACCGVVKLGGTMTPGVTRVMRSMLSLRKRARFRRASVRAALFGALTILAASPAVSEEPAAVLTRDAWGAKPPVLAMVPQRPQRITIHHSASPAKPSAVLTTKLKNLQNFSQRAEKLSDGRMKKVWPDIPYHFYIDPSGTVAEGREVAFVGDTNTEYNPAGHIGVVLEGNFETEQPTARQIASLEKLLVQLARKYAIPASAIAGHKDVAHTACPGRNLEALLPQIRAAVAKTLGSG